MTNHSEGHESHMAHAEHAAAQHSQALSDKTRFTLFGWEDEADKLGLPL